MKIAIITGGSKGIGKALCEKFSNEKFKVFSLARTTSQLSCVINIQADLSKTLNSKTALNTLFNQLDKEKITQILLINNAGRLGEMSSLENISSEDICKTIALNTTTPLVLSSLFINLTKTLSCQKSIINISSGAAKKAYAGWSIYCNSKAAIDMLTKSIHEEQRTLKNGVKSFGIRPGVVDTTMQTKIRNSNQDDFKLKQRFVDLKENNQLYSPQFVATSIFNLYTNNHLCSGETIDLRDFESL